MLCYGERLHFDRHYVLTAICHIARDFFRFVDFNLILKDIEDGPSYLTNMNAIDR